MCIAELRAPVSDAKLAKLPSAFTCFGQQIGLRAPPRPCLGSWGSAWQGRVGPLSANSDGSGPKQSKCAAQISLGSLPAPAAVSMQATDGPSTSAVPATVTDPALGSGPTPADTPMLPAAPMLVPPDLPDTAMSSAMCLWAEDVDIPVDIARQAVLHVHANFASEFSQHPSTDCTCSSKPLQELKVTAIRAVTGELSTLRQKMEVPNEPDLSPNNGLENAPLSDQSMASNPRKGQAKRIGAKTTSHDGKAGHVMTHVCHCVRQED
ncbi:TPA: hypothetical protein ACH3X2_004386 [Trebouxia sp. C0005]